jgi:heptosyltransferase III
LVQDILLLPEKDMPNKNLLIIHQGALGDVVTSFTSLLLLRERYSQIDLISRHSVGRIAENLKVIDRSFSLEAAAFSSLFGKKQEKFNDRIITFLKNYDNIILFSFSKDLAENIKHASGKIVFQIPPRPQPSEKFHVAQYLISCMVDAKLIKGKTENNLLDAYQDFRDPDVREKKVLIHPGSGSRMKNWPLQNFLKLGKLLSNDGFEPLFILGPAEDGVAETILKNRLSDEQQVLQLFDSVELVNILKTGRAFIGNDSGVSHLAAFIGVPTLVIFGPTQPLRWRPLGRKVEIIINNRFDCDPCFETLKRECEFMDCLLGISIEQVRTKFNEFI